MTTKALLFDKDGTLLDFFATFNRATALVLSDMAQGDATTLQRLADVLKFDLKTETIADDSVIVAGTGSEMAKLIGPVLERSDFDQLGGDVDRAFGQACLKTVALLPGIEDALSDLVRAGYVLGVATNDAEANARSQLEALAIADKFAHVFGADSGYGAKPMPGMISAFLEVTGLNAREAIMIGDSLHDLHAGKAAGTFTCGVETGPAKREDLEDSADWIIASVGDLPELLKNQCR